MNIEETNLNDVLKIFLEPFIDFRGSYTETYNKALYEKHGIDVPFVQDDISVSSRHVLRGLHGDAETWKLITCLQGSFYLVVVNNDKNSTQYRKWTSFTLTENNNVQVLVPPHFGNGHLVLTDKAIFHYKQNTYYDPSRQFTIKWNDPEYGFWWPIKTPIISRRDDVGHFID